MAPSTVMGIYPPDSVMEVASSLPLDPLAPGAADLLASDLEYRIHLIAQEARKFMYNSHRTTLLPEDTEYAMEALNVEPILIPPKPLPQNSFVAIPPTNLPGSNSSTNRMYHVPDDEIDFTDYLKKPLPAGLANSAGVKWKAHWLAVEGVQPAIPENPAPGSRAGPSRQLLLPAKPQAKSHLPQELQLYFTRLTSTLVPTDPNVTFPLPEEPERHRQAALASLRSDAAVAGILVYLMKWFAESLGRCLMGSTGVLGGLLDGVEGVLENECIFLEPYLHQLLAPIMSVLLSVPLGPYPQPNSYGNLPSPYDVRVRASEVLKKIVELYGSKYPGLTPRLASTFISAFKTDPFPSPLGGLNAPTGRYEGSILGLTALGPAAIRNFLIKAPTSQTQFPPLCWISENTAKFYPTLPLRRHHLLKATFKAIVVLVGKPPDGDKEGAGAEGGGGGKAPRVNLDVAEVARLMGGVWADPSLTKKQAWLVAEALKLVREDEARHAGMEVDQPGT